MTKFVLTVKIYPIKDEYFYREGVVEKIKNGIIKLLSENARYTTKQMAAMIGEDEQKVASVLEEMQTSGEIVKYAAIFNTDKMQDKTGQALIEVKVAPQKLNGFDAYAEQFYHFKEVQSLIKALEKIKEFVCEINK